jgi:hypothetical protein
MYTLERLLEIKEAAKAAKACVSQYKKFVEFLKTKDIKNAWATVMGSADWCIDNRVITQSELDNYSGAVLAFHKNGQPMVKSTYINGVYQ